MERVSWLALAIGCSLCLSVDAGVPAAFHAGQHPPFSAAAVQPASEPRVTVTGTRLTRGDAVECPKLRSDDGTVVGISYLPPAIKIGGRVSVTGFFAVVTHCRGRVLVAESTQALDGT